MQTPAGFTIVQGKFIVTDFYEVIFNPSTAIRMFHMTMAGFETSVFVVAGVSAYYLLKNRHTTLFQRSLSLALVMAALFAPLQFLLGDLSGRIVFEHQPAKLAAMESHWETNKEKGAPFAIVAIPDENQERNKFELAIPGGLSLLATHSLTGSVPGLREFPRENSTQCSAALYHVPRYGRHRHTPCPGHGLGAPALEKRKNLHASALSLDALDHSSSRLRGSGKRMDNYRSRPAALAGL